MPHYITFQQRSLPTSEQENVPTIITGHVGCLSRTETARVRQTDRH